MGRGEGGSKVEAVVVGWRGGGGSKAEARFGVALGARVRSNAGGGIPLSP